MNKTQLTKLTNLQQHLLFWSVYAFYFYVVNILGNEDVTIGLVILSLPYFAFVFYAVLYILQRFLARRQYLRCVSALLLFYSISSLLVWGITHGDWTVALIYGTYMVSDYAFSWQEFVQTLMAMHLQFSILAFVYFHYRGKLVEERQKVAEMERRLLVEEEKERYEYAALAAQVSPHMMGNIFQSWSRQLNATAPGISRQMLNMYGLMKFYMQAHDGEGRMTILLKDEIDAVRCFVEAQREMPGKAFFVDWDLQGNMLRFGVPPTTILTLVKNAFKHGDIYGMDVPLTIAVEVGLSHYRVQVSNRKLDGETTLQSHGRGLRNLKKRLDMAFGERAKLEIMDTEDMYRVDLFVDSGISEGGSI